MEAPRWIDATEVRQAVLSGSGAATDQTGARRRVRSCRRPVATLARRARRPVAHHAVVDAARRRGQGAVGSTGNPDRGLERIQALYVLFDPDTLAPSIILDGTAITALRTPAVSAVAIDALAPADVASVVVFGSGPQAVGHVEAILEIRQPGQVTIVGRDMERACSSGPSGVRARRGGERLSADDSHIAQVVADLAVVVTATSSGTRSSTVSGLPTEPASSRSAHTSPTGASSTHGWSDAHSSSSRTSLQPFARPETSSWRSVREP